MMVFKHFASIIATLVLCFWLIGCSDQAPEEKQDDKQSQAFTPPPSSVWQEKPEEQQETRNQTEPEKAEHFSDPVKINENSGKAIIEQQENKVKDLLKQYSDLKEEYKYTKVLRDVLQELAQFLSRQTAGIGNNSTSRQLKSYSPSPKTKSNGFSKYNSKNTATSSSTYNGQKTNRYATTSASDHGKVIDKLTVGLTNQQKENILNKVKEMSRQTGTYTDRRKLYRQETSRLTKLLDKMRGQYTGLKIQIKREKAELAKLMEKYK